MQTVSFTGTTKTITYTYDATGLRLRKAYYNGTATITTGYSNGFVYTNGALEYIGMPEGRIVPVTGGYDYQYNLTDHLGNVREVFHPKSDGTAELLQENHYYPFGLEMPGLGYVKQAPESKYRFNGKELQDENNLSMLDFGARMYDPQIGRWWSVDPSAEKFYDITPFRFGLNNPLRYNDPNGRTEEERNRAINVARGVIGTAYKSDLPDYNRIDQKIKLDCSGFVSYCITQNETIGNPYDNWEKGDGGVDCVVKGSNPISINEIVDGNLIVLGKNCEENWHVGFVINVVKENGNVTQYDILHSEMPWRNGKGGGFVTTSHVVVGEEKGYGSKDYTQNFYKFDNPDTPSSNKSDKGLKLWWSKKLGQQHKLKN